MKGSAEFYSLWEENKGKRPLLLIGDPDGDGLLSLKLMCEFCDMQGLDYIYYVNDNREHGFKLDSTKYQGYLILSADFTITQAEVESIIQHDIILLSTDHHQCQDTFIHCKNIGEGIVINNQYPFEPVEDRYLSGAGVFYELICSLYPEFKSSEREAMVGITLLTDIREIENNKAKAYLKKTYSSDPQEGYANYLIESTMDSSSYTFGYPRLDRNFIDYTLSPFINSLLRFNKTDEAVEFVLGKSPARSNTRGLQKELISEINEKCFVLDLPSVAIIAVNALDYTQYGVSLTNFIGLFCSDYKDRHSGKSTLGFVWDNGRVSRASFRGKYDDVQYLTGFKNMGIKADGHANAFGLIDLMPNDDLWVDINDLVTDLEADHVPTYHIIETSNLALTLTQKGINIATENCYVRDMYRTFIKYTGVAPRINRQTYKVVEDDVNYDFISQGKGYRYLVDDKGNKLSKYIEYSVNGRIVKSFGVSIEDGVIMPILEKGYIQLYVKKL